jgi:hypothetical protein
MRLRSNTLPIFIFGLVAQLGLHFLLRQTTGLSSNIAMIAAGMALWSVCTILVSERIGDRWASLKDYADIHDLSSCLMVLVAIQMTSALPSGAAESAILVGLFPPLLAAAIQGVIYRAQFTSEEREVIRTMRRQRMLRA